MSQTSRGRFRWLRRLFGQSEALDAELQACLDILVEQQMAQGVSPADARRLARLEIGGLQQVKERVEDGTIGAAVGSFVQDLRYAARSALRNRLLSLTTVMLTAASIGVLCAAYEDVEAVLYRKLPVPKPEELVYMQSVAPPSPNLPPGIPGTARMFDEIAKDSSLVHQFFGWVTLGLQATMGPTTRSITVIGVTGDFFASQAAVPALGRLFDADEHGDVVVISDALWRGYFGSDPNVVGQHITLGARAITVVGVLPSSFRGLTPTLARQSFMPLKVMHSVRNTPNWEDFSLEAGARLKPGVTRAAYEAQLTARWPAIVDATKPGTYTLDAWRTRRGTKALVRPLGRGVLNDIPFVRRPLLMTFGLAIVIFLGALVTVALLAVARSLREERDAAIRLAIGGTRARVLRPLMLESLLVSLVGCAGGVWAAAWLIRLTGDFLPRGGEAWVVRIDGGVIALAIALGLVTTMVRVACSAGMMPAGAVLSLVHRGPSSGSDRVRFRTVLLTLQCAITVVLLQYAVLYVRELNRLSQVPLGFNPHGLHVFQVSGKLPPPDASFDPARYMATLIEELRAVPRVQAVGMTGGGGLPLESEGTFQPVKTDDGREGTLRTVCVFPGYFDVLQVPFAAGRDFTWTDRTAAVVSTRLARNLYPEGSAIGHTIQTGRMAPLEIVGVVGDMAYSGQRAGDAAAVAFVPCLEFYKPFVYTAQAAMRSDRSLNELEVDVRGVVDRLGVQYLFSTYDQDEVVTGAMQNERLLAQVSSLFSSSFILLTGAGLYAFCSYLLMLRTGELAIRAALGAGPVQIAQTMWRELGVVLIAGAVLGAALSATSRRVLSSLMTETPAATIDLVVGLAILVAIVAGASLGPTLRAIRMDIARALRAV